MPISLQYTGYNTLHSESMFHHETAYCTTAVDWLPEVAFLSLGISDSHGSTTTVLLDENLVYYVESPFHDAAVHTAWDWQGQGLKVKNTSCLQLNNKWHKPDLKERCSGQRSDQCYIIALFKKWRLNLLFPSPPGAARDLFPFPAWSVESLYLHHLEWEIILPPEANYFKNINVGRKR